MIAKKHAESCCVSTIPLARQISLPHLSLSPKMKIWLQAGQTAAALSVRVALCRSTGLGPRVRAARASWCQGVKPAVVEQPASTRPRQSLSL